MALEFYTLVLPLDRQEKDMSLREDGQVGFCWNKDYLYVSIKFNDADVIAMGKEDNIHHYKLGDLCEIFLKSANETYYWELYATPVSRKTAFYFPTKLHQPIIIDKEFCDKMTVKSQITGTLNKNDDKDSGWTAEMAIPVKQFKKYGAEFSEGQFWTVLIGYIVMVQFSSFFIAGLVGGWACEHHRVNSRILVLIDIYSIWITYIAYCVYFFLYDKKSNSSDTTCASSK